MLRVASMPSWPPKSLHNDFRELVGGGWQAVVPAVRERMDLLLTADEPTIFVGTGFVRRTRMGWLYAQLARVFGAPLSLRRGEAVKTTVRVAPTINGFRCWHRTFEFEDGSTQVIETTKLVDRQHGLLDAVGARGEKLLATRMRVWTEGESLHFASTGYILRIGGVNIPIPSLFTPGRLHAEHRDLGDGTFMYVLKFHHPVWGDTFHHEGRFRMV